MNNIIRRLADKTQKSKLMKIISFLPLQLAAKSLQVHRGRTFLTVLGIIIGIAAVIIVMSANTLEIMGIEVERGRAYSAEEDDQLVKAAVIGFKVAADLFGNNDPLGKNIKIGQSRFRVIGVAKEKGMSFGFNYDEMVYLPLKTTQKLLMGIDYLMFITVKVYDANVMEATASEIEDLLRANHEITEAKDDDFAVTTATEALEIINTVFGGMTLLLVAIAGISLLVGGVGIMNIMYVSVTERTFEIGLRKSLGAKKKQILWQFLWEAIVVTMFGGLIGIIIGVTITFLISFIAAQIGFSWDFVLPPQSVIIAFLFSTMVGLIFGYYPAQKAAALDPIAALRYEK